MATRRPDISMCRRTTPAELRARSGTMRSCSSPPRSEPPTARTALTWPSSARVMSSRSRTGRRSMPSTCSGCADGEGWVVDVKRARALLTVERREIEQTLSRRGHENDGEDAGWLEPGNLAAGLYLDELDESLAEELRDRLAALERAEDRLAAGTYGLSIESGQPIPDERLEALPTAERTVDEERALGEGRG